MDKERKSIAGNKIGKNQSRLTRNPKTNKGYNKKPNYKIRKAFKAYTTGEAKTLQEAKEIAGYPATKNTSEITKSKSWEVLMEQYLSDSKLTKTHNQLLDSPNENIQIKAVDLGYKVKGKYIQEDNTKTIVNVQVNNLYKNALET